MCGLLLWEIDDINLFTLPLASMADDWQASLQVYYIWVT
jgi:hypothetical protein